ncbi:hypothetical protein [Gloeothece verrucosa]|uniref:Uncharacterized protein n=1 Tax=Gloeothece verrucosa (strain PCC 7822) TaxID=497965 RepID=E0UH95_GLOV7|nr:hypothetical protein [Gloeothece verrucosa]ADN16809.1 hypothetical protein Cyan7822_4918 [Gloeothece verrucosa PCC 7822]
MINCPCCSNQMLRHIRHQGIYWFCPHCYQEMPNFETLVKEPLFFNKRELSRFPFKQDKKILVASA